MSLGPAELLLAVAGLLFWGAGAAAWRRRDEPGAALFTAVTGVAGSGAVALALTLALGWSRTASLAVIIVVSLVLPIPWLFFSFRYTGRTELVSLAVVAVVGALPLVGLLASALIFGSQLFPWMSLPSRGAAGGLDAVVVALLGIVQQFALLYAGGLMLFGSGLLLWTFRRYDYLNPATGMLLGTFGTVTWLSLLFGLQVAEVNPLALPRTVAIGFLIGSVALCGILWRYTLFSDIPAAGNVGPTTVIEEMDDAVIVTGSDETVIDVNEAAARDLDATAADNVGADVEQLLDVSLQDARESDTIEVETETARRLYEPTVSELTDHHDRCLGYALALRDVTARTTRRQRLEVLNRVIRHNLGNDLNVVLGQAEWIQHRTDDEKLGDSAETIVRNADGLVEMAEDAANIARLIDTTASRDQDVTLAPLVGGVRAATAPDDGTVDWDVTVPEDIVIEGQRDLVELAIRNLVENAIEHNDTDCPQVMVTASYDPEETYSVAVTVADDGPGIPGNEQRAVLRGSVQQLDHGLGLGLWAVRWAVTKLGGTIDFRERDPRGTTIVLRFPRGYRTASEADSKESDRQEQ